MKREIKAMPIADKNNKFYFMSFLSTYIMDLITFTMTLIILKLATWLGKVLRTINV